MRNRVVIQNAAQRSEGSAFAFQPSSALPQSRLPTADNLPAPLPPPALSSRPESAAADGVERSAFASITLETIRPGHRVQPSAFRPPRLRPRFHAPTNAQSSRTQRRGMRNRVVIQNAAQRRIELSSRTQRSGVKDPHLLFSQDQHCRRSDCQPLTISQHRSTPSVVMRSPPQRTEWRDLRLRLNSRKILLPGRSVQPPACPAPNFAPPTALSSPLRQRNLLSI
jgi:hypothetical protein